jgi:Tfp pilus assembly protein PilN
MRAVNLLPREEAKGRANRMTIGMQLALVSPFVVGSLLGAGYLLASSKVNDNKATLRALQTELAAIPPPKSAPETNAQLAIQHQQRVSALALALQARVAWDRILREVSSVLPEDVWLTTLSAQSPQGPGTAAPPPSTTTGPVDIATTSTETTPTPPPAPTPTTAVPLSIGGYTYSQEGVARFMSRLGVIPELENLKLVSSTETAIAQRTVVQFQIQADVRKQDGS